MAPFNQRQIGYIQAIAGRQQHRTLTCGQHSKQISSQDALAAADFAPQLLDSNAVIGQGQNGTHDDAKSLLMHHWLLDHVYCTYDTRTDHNDNKLTTGDITGLSHFMRGMGNYTAFEVFEAPCQGTYRLNAGTVPEDYSHTANTHFDEDVADGELVRNPELIPSHVRATPDGFLNSTNLKFRFTLPRTLEGGSHDQNHGSPMGQDHFEFRWIVWRSKRPTLHWASGLNGQQDELHSNLEAIRDGVSFRNPAYDLFMGQTGRKRGFLGYTLNKDLDKEKGNPDAEAYSGYRWDAGTSSFVTSGTKYAASKPEQEAGFTVDDLMTARLNKDDYVIMKDVRFFLGKEHGKSHFEDTLHWDWNDPIDTESDNVLSSPTLNNKNYRWHMTLLGTSGGSGECALNCRALWTTKMESG